jgi:hypothetical protein
MFETKAFDSVSDADIECCSNFSYPFVLLVSPNEVMFDMPLNFITASTDWVVRDYGNAISATAPYSKKIKQNATSVLAQAKTAEELMRLIAKKGWVSVELVGGTQIMERFVWVEAKIAEIDLVGYTPSANDEKCYECLAKYFEEIGRKKYLKPKIEECEGATTAS